MFYVLRPDRFPISGTGVCQSMLGKWIVKRLREVASERERSSCPLRSQEDPILIDVSLNKHNVLPIFMNREKGSSLSFSPLSFIHLLYFFIEQVLCTKH